MSHHNHHEHNHHDHHEHHHHGHDHHHHADFKELFLKSLPLGLLILWMSPMMDIRLPFQITFPYSDIIVTILSTILLIYGGKPFFQGAIDEFKQKSPSMMALVSLGISVSYLYSVYAVVNRYLTNEHMMDFFFEFSSLILIMLLGHWIEMKAIQQAGDAQESLAQLLPKEVSVVLENDVIEKRSLEDVHINDILSVAAGENIPADGIIISGESRINEALLTGESKPILKQVNDEVIGGSTNGEGHLLIKVTQTGEASFISQVQHLIMTAQASPSRGENLANKVASWLFYIALIVAIVAFIIWFNIEDLQTAIRYSVTVLVIACPHALGLAIPLVIARSTSLGSQRGLLVQNREALEQATKATHMVIDKTGTLTTGDFKVLQVSPLDNSISKEHLTALLAGIEAGSSHPIATSILSYATEQNIQPLNFEQIENITGAGIKGIYQDKEYQLISLKSYNKDLSINLPQQATISVLLQDQKPLGVVALGDELKSTSKDLMKTLKKYNIIPIMATGDNEQAAKHVATQLNIDYKANQSPHDKYELIQSLQEEFHPTIMVGDGINDAPSLALSDVGIAVGAGTKVAIDSADVILTQSDPNDIQSFLELAYKTSRKMKENLIWGAGYNFIAIPLAAGILSPIGITLTPAMGAILMSLSTIIVAFNAMLLKLDK